MGARYGDGFVTLQTAETVPLRLTFGALAEVARRLDASGPLALAARLNPLREADAKTIAGAMSFAATGQRDLDINTADLPAISAAIAAQIDAAFSGAFL